MAIECMWSYFLKHHLLAKHLIFCVYFIKFVYQWVIEVLSVLSSVFCKLFL